LIEGASWRCSEGLNQKAGQRRKPEMSRKVGPDDGSKAQAGGQLKGKSRIQQAA
jgi:hypothetical protein